MMRYTLIFLCVSISVFGAPFCARAKIEILQELSLERQAFEARMKISNPSSLAVENLRVEVLFQDETGNGVWASSDPNQTGAAFFIRSDCDQAQPDPEGSGWTLTDVPSQVTGDSSVPSVEARWLIVPAPGAGGESSRGALYRVGARVRYTQGQEEYTIDVAPDTIRVLPMPTLSLDYFLPVDVPGDDPDTPGVIEPSTPFPLGLRVRNTGPGTAGHVRIDSGQPRIVDNYQGIPLGFSIVGSSVNGQPSTPGLQVDFGDLEPGRTAVADWKMTCSLEGRFVSFGASISHADELGGRLTSLIPEQNIRTYALIGEVLTQGDLRPAFLACSRQSDGSMYTDRLEVCTAGGQDESVSDQSGDASLEREPDGNYALTRSAYNQDPGYIFIRIRDPFMGHSALIDVVRSDGTVLSTSNAWLSRSRADGKACWYLNLFDWDTAGKNYRVRYRDASPTRPEPQLAFIPDRAIRTGRQFGLVVKASVSDGSVPFLYTGPLPSGASFEDRRDGTGLFSWTPEGGQTGSHPILFAASNADLTVSQTAMFLVTASDENHAPVADWNSAWLPEDTDFSGKLTGRDLDNDPLTFTITRAPGHGTLTAFDPATGAFTYRPEPEYSGDDSLNFTVSDGKATSLETSFVLYVDPVNDPPVSVSVRIHTRQNQASQPVRPEVSDPDSTEFVFSIPSQPRHGRAEVVNNLLVYTPETDFFGEDSFPVVAKDEGGLSVTGTAIVQVEESPFDLAVKGLSLSGSTLTVSVTSSRSQALPGVKAELVLKSRTGSEPLASRTVELAPGSGTLTFDLGTTPAAGSLLVLSLTPPEGVPEADPWNNRASFGTGLPLTLTLARPEALAPGSLATLSGRSFYRTPEDGEGGPTLPVEGGLVTVTLTKEGEAQPAVTVQGRTDRNGAWSVPLAAPASAGPCRLAVQVEDGAARERVEDALPVDAALVPAPPFPGPGGSTPVVRIEDSTAQEAWVVAPGTPVPTTGETGSGLLGGATGTGDSASLRDGGPALGARGQTAGSFDALVKGGTLEVSSENPEVGQSIRLHGVILANDSLYGLPVQWQVTGSDGKTRPLAPPTWYYLNGDLHLLGSFTPPSEGTFALRLALVQATADADPSNDVAVKNIVARRPNHDPVIGNATIPDHAWVGEILSCAVQAQDEDGDPLTFSWSFGDGTTATGTSNPVTHIYGQAGTYALTLLVEDGKGGRATLSREVKVETRPNRNPVIGSVTIPSSAGVNQAASLGAQATDPDGDILSYAWSFGDGTTGSGATTAHTWAGAGVYTVTLSVTDGRGGEATASQTVTVSATPNHDPVLVSVSRPSETQPGVPVTLSATASDPDGDPLRLLWSFGDGVTAEGASVSHAWSLAGSYTVQLDVTDGRGGRVQDFGLVKVRGTNRDPRILSVELPTPARPGMEALLRVEAIDPDGDELTVSWSLGDGTTAQGAEIRHTWTADGSYTVRVTVTDGHGGSAESTGTVRVTATPVNGDLDGDGSVEASDLAILIGYETGLLRQGVPPFTASLAQADLDGNGRVDAADVEILAQWLSGNR